MPVIETAAVVAARTVVGNALGPLSNGIVESWAATSKLGPNISALKMELLYAHGMLNNARGMEIHNDSLEELLLKLRDLAYSANDALDELDYFRIQDELEGTYETADRGCFRDFIRDTRHTTRAAVSKLTSCLTCCAHEADPQDLEQDGRGNMCFLPGLVSGARNAVCSVGRRLQICSSQPSDGNDSEESDAGVDSMDSQMAHDDCKIPSKKWHAKTGKLELNRVDLSKRMKGIVDEFQPVCAKVATILNLELLNSNRSTTKNNTTDRPKTAPVTEDPELYGRDAEMKIILDGISHKFCNKKDLTIIPIVGHGGLGKTTFAQHIYQKAKSSFEATIWICVSANYSVNKLMQETKEKIPEVQGENKNTSDEELIQQRLKSRRFLLVLDDLWTCHEDEWKRLLAPFRAGGARGNMVLVTTRIPDLVTKLGIAENLIELKGLARGPFEKYFLACIFGRQKQGEEHNSFVEDIGSKIMEKLKGSPLAAKTVGRLLRDNLSEDYWRRVLESKEWELQTDDHDIMPALKLSYDYLPFHLQQCFSYCALFPEDYEFRRDELIHLWIGLEILHGSGHNKRTEDIGRSYLNELLMHGFLDKIKRREHDYYVIHDLLRDLALMISSNECLSISYSNVRSIEVHPYVRHLSIIMDDADHGGGLTDECFMREIRQLKKRLNLKNLQTLMLFDNGRLTSTFGYLFKEVYSLRVLYVSAMTYPVKHMLENFSKLIHLRYLRLGSHRKSEIQVPSTVSRFYHLRILDLEAWNSRLDLPSDICNLVNLHYFLAGENPHSEISMVGKLQLLRELKMFQVKRREEGFDLKELEPLMEMNSLGIYNLENVLTAEAGEANLAYKNCLHKLTLHWGRNIISADHAVETHVLESLRPHSSLKELRVIGHRGYTCPTWLGSGLSVRGLESLHLDGVEWIDFTSLGDLWLLKQQSLQSLVIKDCVNLSALPPIPWSHTLSHVSIMNVGSGLDLFYDKDYSSRRRIKIEGTYGLRLDEKVLAFHNLTELEDLEIWKCLHLAEEHLQKLTSLKRLSLDSLDKILLPSSNSGGDVKWQLPVKELKVRECYLNLIRLLYHFPMLSDLQISCCDNITRIGVMVAEQEQRTTTVTVPLALATKWADGQLLKNQLQQIEEDEEIILTEKLQKEGLLVLPPHLCSSIQKLSIWDCPDLILEQQGGGLQGLCSLVTLSISGCPNLLSAYASSSSCPFPSSLNSLYLRGIMGMEAVGSRGEGLWPFLTQGDVTELSVFRSPKFFAGCETTREQNEKLCPCKLQDLNTDDSAGLFTTPVCSLLSSSLTKLCLYDPEVVTFTEDQGNALQLLTSLQQLKFVDCYSLEALPLFLNELSKLERIDIIDCRSLRWSVWSLPSSLQVLDVSSSRNEILKQECYQLIGTIPKLIL